MTTPKKYQSTIIACYIGNFVQAISVNITPILLIPLRNLYNISYAQFGFLVMLNFTIQVIVDLLFSKAVDKHGFRRFVVTSHILCLSGFLFFGAAPLLFPNNVFLGLILGTMLFAGSSGLLELLLSPIVDAIPTKEKDKAMAMLHSFYAWGQAAVVALTTLLVFVKVPWQLIMAIWAIVPLINTFIFARVPLCQKHPDDIKLGIRGLLKTPLFYICFFAIAFGGAAEVSMAQWVSAFAEKGLGFAKVYGDLLGTCGFALTLGLGRAFYASNIKKPPLTTMLCSGALGAVVCYIVAVISPYSWLSLAACAVCGLCVSLLWPGTIVIASSKMPMAGASLFALLAAGGDLGAAIGPWFSGVITTVGISIGENISAASPEAFGLRIGLLVAAAFPLCAFVFNKMLAKRKDSMSN